MLLLVAGAWQVVGRPIAAAVNSSPPPAATTTVSDDQARTTAVVAVTDWLTYNPQTLSAYRNIAGARFGNGAAASAWSGSAWMAPDAVTAGTVVTQPDGDLVTQVTARVRIATPAQPTKTPTPPQSTSGDPGNDPTVPAGWTVVSTQWLHLLVPITAAGRPDPAGPVLATANQPRTTTATRHRINRLHCDDQQPTVGGQPVHRIGRDRRDRTRLPHHEPTDHPAERSGAVQRPQHLAGHRPGRRRHRQQPHRHRHRRVEVPVAAVRGQPRLMWPRFRHASTDDLGISHCACCVSVVLNAPGNIPAFNHRRTLAGFVPSTSATFLTVQAPARSSSGSVICAPIVVVADVIGSTLTHECCSCLLIRHFWSSPRISVHDRLYFMLLTDIGTCP